MNQLHGRTQSALIDRGIEQNWFKPQISPKVVVNSATQILIIGLLAFAGLLILLAWLDWQGVIARDLVFLGEKARLALAGPAPRFQSFGFVFPPLPLYGIVLAFGSPLLFQALASAVLVGLMGWRLYRLPVPVVWRWTWLALVLLQPAFGLMLLRSPSWVVASLLLLVSTRLLWELQVSLDEFVLPPTLLLVLLGLALAPLMLVRLEAWGLLPVVALLVFTLFVRRALLGFSLAAVLVTGFMSVISIIAFLYFNWISTNSAFYFLDSPYGGLQRSTLQALFEQAPFFTAIGETVAAVGRWLPVYALLVVLAMGERRRRFASVAIASLPLFLIFLSLWWGIYIPAISTLGLFLGVLPLLLQHLSLASGWRRWAVTIGLVVSLLSSGAALQGNVFIPEETIIWRTLSFQTLPDTRGVQTYQQLTAAEQDMADTLQRVVNGGEKVLMDDFTGAGVLYRYGDPQAFILPYQYEFIPALQHPDLYANFVLLPVQQAHPVSRDRIEDFWPNIQQRPLKNFVLLKENTHFQLFQRSSPEM